jgi:hypothetical protein
MTYSKAWAVVEEPKVALVGGDAHYWPNQDATAHRAFVLFAHDLKPDVIINIGDSFDGAGISRHPPIGWENFPKVVDQVDECKAKLADIAASSRRRTRHIWTLGNHDARFETFLASKVPEYANIYGVHLKDHFPDWEPAWAVRLGDQRLGLTVKHRWHNGQHAAFNNTVKGGVSIATGHTHRLQVLPYTDANGTRYGIETGMLANPKGPQFEPWLEANPTQWRAGFVVARFNNGRLLEPELVSVVNEAQGLVQYRGEIFTV